MGNDKAAGGQIDQHTAAALVERGIARCRKGEWERGLDDLGKLARNEHQGELPGVFYSYLGYGIARCRGQVHEGVRLCEHAVKVEFYNPENYLNLARTYLLADNRRRAYKALTQGLRTDRRHTGLIALARQMGWRRRPVLPFISRDNPVNRFLGRLRHDLRRDR